MKTVKVIIENNPFCDFASAALTKLGLINDFFGKMRGSSGKSKNPKWRNWRGMGWGELEIELFPEGIKVLEQAPSHFGLKYYIVD